jgi:hypothetical protein
MSIDIYRAPIATIILQTLYENFIPPPVRKRWSKLDREKNEAASEPTFRSTFDQGLLLAICPVGVAWRASRTIFDRAHLPAVSAASLPI